MALISRSRVAVRILHVRGIVGFTAMENGNNHANGGEAAGGGGDKGGKNKRLSVERMYKKVKPIEHILLRYAKYFNIFW